MLDRQAVAEQFAAVGVTVGYSAEAMKELIFANELEHRKVMEPCPTRNSIVVL